VHFVSRSLVPAQYVLVFDDQHNLWTNMFASVYACSSHDAKRIGLRH
jgi:hypothetical protein